MQNEKQKGLFKHLANFILTAKELCAWASVSAESCHLLKSHGRRSLVGCSPWGCEESDTTERLHFHFSLSCIGEGNGNPLQYSCGENPRDGGARWAAVYGVTQSQTRLKRLSSSSSSHLLKHSDCSSCGPVLSSAMLLSSPDIYTCSCPQSHQYVSVLKTSDIQPHGNLQPFTWWKQPTHRPLSLSFHIVPVYSLPCK